MIQALRVWVSFHRSNIQQNFTLTSLFHEGSIFSNYKIPKRKAEDVKVTETSFTIPLTWAEPAKTTPRAQMTPWQDVYKTATDTPAMNLTSLTQQLNTYIVKAPEKLQEVPKGATKRPERTCECRSRSTIET